MLKGVKRITRYTVQKKIPIIIKYLYKLYSHFRGKRFCLAILRTTLIYVLSFMGFLRFGEVIDDDDDDDDDDDNEFFRWYG